MVSEPSIQLDDVTKWWREGGRNAYIKPFIKLHFNRKLAFYHAIKAESPYFYWNILVSRSQWNRWTTVICCYRRHIIMLKCNARRPKLRSHAVHHRRHWHRQVLRTRPPRFKCQTIYSPLIRAIRIGRQRNRRCANETQPCSTMNWCPTLVSLSAVMVRHPLSNAEFRCRVLNDFCFLVSLQITYKQFTPTNTYWPPVAQYSMQCSMADSPNTRRRFVFPMSNRQHF